MKILLTIALLVFTSSLYAQSLAAEQERLNEFSKNTSIESFSKATDLRKTPRKGDLIVLKDDQSRLYYGMIDTVRSMNSIGIILYSSGRREIAEAALDDLFYLKAPVENKTTDLSEDEKQKIWKNLLQKEEQIRALTSKLEQTTLQVEAAGKAYEISDILSYVSYGCLFLGATIGAASAYSANSKAGTVSGLFIAGWAGTGIASIVYRFKGHNRLKFAGSRRW